MDTKVLRQKILDLAIRGKLVPQDPNDEPASVLLERIREQKKQMVKEGKLKAKDIKNDTIIFVGEDNLHYEKFQDGTVKCIEDEIPFELPEGWEWCRLISICSKLIDGDHNPPKGEEYITEYMMLSSTNINHDALVDLKKVRYLSKSIFERENQRTDVNVGDIFFTSVGSIGRSCVYTGGYNICFQRSVSVIRTLIFNDFLKYYLDAPFIQEKIEQEATGTAQKGFYLNQLSNCLIAVPPMCEQHRIADMIKAYIAIINKISFDNASLQELIKQTKSKILDLAIRGKLVPQDPNDEPASVLLERIRAEKEELIKQGKIKRDKKESIIFRGDDNSYYEKIKEKCTCIDDELPLDIPEHWMWSKIDSIAFVTKLAGFEYTKNIAPNLCEKGVPLFKGKNIQNSTIIYEFEAFIPEEVSDELSRSQITRKCILTPYVGTIGNIGIHNKPGKYHLGSNVGKIELYNEKAILLEEYVVAYLQSSYGYQQLTKHMKATAQPSISIEAIRDVYIPIPPENEQKKIVLQLNAISSKLEIFSKC